jgi:hypothetical protein
MKLTIQNYSDMFNEAYAKACVSSKPEDWGKATIIARQMVVLMTKENIITDNFSEVYDKIDQE